MFAAVTLCAGCASNSPDGSPLARPAATTLEPVECRFLAVDWSTLQGVFNGESGRPQESALVWQIAQRDGTFSPSPLVRTYVADLNVMAADLGDGSASLTADVLQVRSDYQAIESACGG